MEGGWTPESLRPSNINFNAGNILEEGYTNLLLNDSIEPSLSDSGKDSDENSGGSGNGIDYYEDNKNYWDSILDLNRQGLVRVLCIDKGTVCGIILLRLVCKDKKFGGGILVDWLECLNDASNTIVSLEIIMELLNLLFILCLSDMMCSLL
ncbi:hypothetical protein V6N11_047385 [Hibiscus sabdariffa]|uniref:Uncharacterized protein n=1 Tax=Hibiscus sabdariffa TaxID=183260 RepID=A0ABR1ZGH5_9ROSI